MSIRDQLIVIKNNVHSGNDVAGSMDKLINLLNIGYDDPREREVIKQMVITAKDDLLNGYPISTFDDAYLIILSDLSHSGKI